MAERSRLLLHLEKEPLISTMTAQIKVRFTKLRWVHFSFLTFLYLANTSFNLVLHSCYKLIYFYRARWPGDWIAAVRKLLWDKFDWSYCFRENIAQLGGNESCSMVYNWPFYIFLYLLYHRVSHWPSPRTCLIISLPIAFLSILSMKWAAICAQNLKTS